MSKLKRTDQLIGFRHLTEKELVVKHQERLLGKLKNTAEIRSQKKEIARMKTILDEKIAANLTEHPDGKN